MLCARSIGRCAAVLAPQTSRLRTLARSLAYSGDVAKQRMAILFDADNVPARLAGVILEEIHRQVPGVSIDRRVYGDFSSPRNEPWKTAALQLGIEPRMATSPSRMKNATDIALVIGAMDILHESDARSVVDTFVLVTNDSDFAPLAQRLRRSGKRVVAVGTGSTLITSCDCFISIDYTRMPSAVSDSSHVRTLVGLAYDLSLGSGGDSSAVVNPFADGAWISVGTLAQHIDRQQPGWRLARMEGFVNFRHMLETEPWRSAFELRLGPTSVGELQGMASGAASGAADSLLPHQAYVQLLPHARAAEEIRRGKAERERERPAGAASNAAMAAAEPAAAAAAAPAAPPATASACSWGDRQVARTEAAPVEAAPAEADTKRQLRTLLPSWLGAVMRSASMATAAPGTTASAPPTSAAAVFGAVDAAARLRPDLATSGKNLDLAIQQIERNYGSQTAPAASDEATAASSASSNDASGAPSVVHDVSFILEVLQRHVGTPEAMLKRPGPPGDGWVLVATLATAIDHAAEASGRGQKWRKRLQGRRPFLEMLQHPPYDAVLEFHNVDRGKSIDSYARSAKAQE